MSQQRVRMLIKNLWDDATLSVGTGALIPTLPLEHTQQYGHSKTAAITPDAEHTSVINFTMPDFAIASGLCIYRHWLSNAAKWHLELFDATGQTGNLVYDSGLIDCVEIKTIVEMDWFIDPLIASPFDSWPYRFSNLWFPRTFFQSGRLTLVDANARGGIHEYDRIYLGAVFEPKVNFSYSHQAGWTTSETQKKSAGGSTFANERVHLREVDFSLNWIDENERPLLSQAINYVGLSKDWFISMYPEAGGQKEIEYAMSCKFKGVLPKITHPFYNNYSVPVGVMEA